MHYSYAGAATYDYGVPGISANPAEDAAAIIIASGDSHCHQRAADHAFQEISFHIGVLSFTKIPIT